MIKITQENIQKMGKLYVEDKMSTRELGKLFGMSDPSVSKILKANGFEIRKEGGVSLGGRAEAQKRYEKKNSFDRKEYYAQWQKDNAEDLKIKRAEWRKNKKLNNGQ